MSEHHGSGAGSPLSVAQVTQLRGDCRAAVATAGAVYTADSDGPIRAWSARAGTRGILARRERDSAVSSLATHREASELWAGGNSGELFAISLSDASVKVKAFEAHKGSVQCICSLPSCSAVLSGGSDFALKAWRSPSGEHMLTRNAHHGAVKAIITVPPQKTSSTSSDVFHKEHGAIWTAAGDGAILRWPQLYTSLLQHEAQGNDARGNDAEQVTVKKAGGPGVACLASIKPRWNGRRTVWAGFDDGSVRVYNSDSASLEAEHTSVHRGCVSCIADAGSLVWTGSADHSIVAWDKAKLNKSFVVGDQGGYVRCFVRVGWSVWVFTSKGIRVWSSESLLSAANEEAAGYQQAANDARTEKAKLQSRISELEEKLSNAQNACDNAQQAQSAAEHKTSAIKQEREELQQTAERLRKERDAARNESDDASQQLEIKNEELSKLSEQVKEAQKEREDNAAERERVQQDRDEKSQLIESLQQERDAKAKEAVELRETHVALQSKLDTLKEKTDKLEAERDSKATECEELRKQRNANRDELESMQKQYDALQSQHDNKQENLGRLQHDLDELRSLQASNASSMQSLQEENKQLVAERDAKANEADVYRNQRDKIQSEHDQKANELNSLQQQQDTTSKEVEQLKAENKRLHSEIEEKAETINLLQSERDNVLSEKDEKNQEIGRLKQEIGSMRKERDDKGSEVKRLRDHANTSEQQLRAERDQLKSELHEVQLDRDRANSETSSKGSALERAHSEQDRLADTLKQVREEAQALRKARDDAISQRDNATHELKAEQSRRNVLEEEMHRLSKPKQEQCSNSELVKNTREVLQQQQSLLNECKRLIHSTSNTPEEQQQQQDGATQRLEDLTKLKDHLESRLNGLDEALALNHQRNVKNADSSIDTERPTETLEHYRSEALALETEVARLQSELQGQQEKISTERTEHEQLIRQTSNRAENAEAEASALAERVNELEHALRQAGSDYNEVLAELRQVQQNSNEEAETMQQALDESRREQERLREKLDELERQRERERHSLEKKLAQLHASAEARQHVSVAPGALDTDASSDDYENPGNHNEHHQGEKRYGNADDQHQLDNLRMRTLKWRSNNNDISLAEPPQRSNPSMRPTTTPAGLTTTRRAKSNYSSAPLLVERLVSYCRTRKLFNSSTFSWLINRRPTT